MYSSLNTVFVLGAGASADAGVPLMGDFLERAMLLAPSHHAAAFDLVRKARSKLQLAQSKTQFDLRNVESVFAAFEMAELFGQLGDLTVDETSKLTAAMRTVIVHTIESNMRVPVERDNIIEPPRPYWRFGRLIAGLRASGHHVSIATFNYDIAVELGLNASELDVDYCLSEQEQIGPVELMKLHGSLNWGVCDLCKTIYPRLVRDILRDRIREWRRNGGPDPTQRELRFSLQPALNALTCDNCSSKCRPEPSIVPPTANKSGLHRELRTVWQRTARRLSQADNVFVIGYSWPGGDHFFHQLLALGMVGNKILSRFWVFNPDQDVRERFRQRLLGQQARDCFGPPGDRFTFADAIRTIGAEFGIGKTSTDSADLNRLGSIQASY